MFIQGIASLGQIATSVAAAAVLSVATAVGGQGVVQDADRIEVIDELEGLPDLSQGIPHATRFAETAPSFLTRTPKISRPVVQQASLGGWLAAIGLLGLTGLIAKITSAYRASFALQETRRAVPPVLPDADRVLLSLAADIRANTLSSTGLARLISILGERSNRANVALIHLFDFLSTRDPDSFETAAVWHNLQAIASEPAHLLHDDVHLRLKRLASEERFTRTVFRIYSRILADPKAHWIAMRELKNMVRGGAANVVAAQAGLLLAREEGRATAGSPGDLGV